MKYEIIFYSFCFFGWQSGGASPQKRRKGNRVFYIIQVFLKKNKKYFS
jgi:hypothetical protein